MFPISELIWLNTTLSKLLTQLKLIQLKLQKLFSTTAVSYTHLDVYKRQQLKRAKFSQKTMVHMTIALVVWIGLFFHGCYSEGVIYRGV